MRFDRSKHGAHCSKCPLRDRRRVWSTGPAGTSRVWSGLVLCGEAPGEEEDRQGEPFVGVAGQQGDRHLAAAGLGREKAWLTNIISCRPPANDLSSQEGQEAIECCRPGFEAEITWLNKNGAKVYVPLGTKAMEALGVEGGVTKRRGYVYQQPAGLVVPTFHPSYILRGNFQEIPTVIGDLRKARRLAVDGYKPPTPRLVTHPTLAQVLSFLERCIKRRALLYLDIETTSLIAERGEIVVIGLADSPSFAISVPFLKQGGLRYWKSAEEKRLLRALKEAFAACKIVVHNAGFDPLYLGEKGLPITCIYDDTMQLHHSLHPELPHRLSYIGSTHCDIPYWKDTLEDKQGATLEMEDTKLRTYNLWDVIAPAIAHPKLEDDARILGIYDYHRTRVVPLIPVVLGMTRSGMLLDRTAQQAWQKGLTSKLAKLRRGLYKDHDLPKGFNLGSTEHLGFLLFNAVPMSLQRAKEDYEARCLEIEALSREEKLLTKKGVKLATKEAKRLVSLRGQIQRKSGSAVFKTAGERTELLRALRPLRLPTAARPRTNKKGYSVDDEAILSLKILLNNRILAIEAMKRPPRGASTERTELLATSAFLDGLVAYRETQKLLTTYGDFETWKDGRVHFPFKMTGTATGRLSSGDKKSLGVGNGQNIPPEARKLFIAAPGCVLVGADYNSLEPRVLAYISEDDPAIADFDAGIKVYDAILIKALGITKEHPKWDAIRSAVKVYVLGTNYGGSLETVYRQMSLKVPDLPITLAELKQIHEARMRLHPAYAAWVERTKETVLRTRTLTNFAGRRRVFLGNKSEITRQALDFGPQSGAAEIINRAMVSFDKDPKVRAIAHRKHLHFKKENWAASILVLQIHDALYLEVLKEDAKEAARLLVKHMEAPIDIGCYKNVVFPVELSIGTNWGELKKVKLGEIK